MRARAKTVVLSAALVACSGAGALDVGVDAGVDGGTDTRVDLGHDAGVDSPSFVDAASDASCATPRDGAIDATVLDASPGIDPDWRSVAGYGAECDVAAALHPEGAMAFHWEPCAGALPDCQMTVIDWAPAPLDRVVGVNGGNDERGTLEWHFAARGAIVEDYLVVTRGTRVMAAWRIRLVGMHACAPSLALSADGVAVDDYIAPATGPATERVAVASWANLATLLGPVWRSTAAEIPAGSFLETPSTSATTFAAMTPAGAIIVAEPPRGGLVGHGAYPVVVGHVVMWNWGDAAGARGIHAATLGGGEVELYRAPTGTHTFSVRSEGTWIAWRAGANDPTGATSALNELWAAPYAETGPLDARLLRTDLVGDEYLGTVGDGLYANIGPDPTGTITAVVVTSLADGSRRYVLLPTPDECNTGWWLDPAEVAWVTRDEVAVPMHYVNHPAGLESFDAVLRFDIRDRPAEPIPHVP